MQPTEDLEMWKSTQHRVIGYTDCHACGNTAVVTLSKRRRPKVVCMACRTKVSYPTEQGQRFLKPRLRAEPLKSKLSNGA